MDLVRLGIDSAGTFKVHFLVPEVNESRNYHGEICRSLRSFRDPFLDPLYICSVMLGVHLGGLRPGRSSQPGGSVSGPRRPGHWSALLTSLESLIAVFVYKAFEQGLEIDALIVDYG